MNRSEAKQSAKGRLAEYLNMITEKKGRQYNCPICGSGKGKKKTPAGSLTPNKQYFHCFSCEFHGDIFDLIGKIENISDEAEKFQKAYDIFNIQVSKNPTPKKTHADTQSASEENSISDYTAYFEVCHSRVEETDYFTFRGISSPIVERFMLGYDPQWKSPKALREGKNPPVSTRVIIPTSNQSYVARATDANADPKFKAIKEGSSELFNRKSLEGTAPVFIVEGEFDALSIIEAGGQSLALGSTSNKRKLVELCKAILPKTQIILSLDSDDAGKKAQDEIKNTLKELKLSVLEVDINGGYKDPNEHLINSRETFFQVVQDTIEYASQHTREMDEIKKAEISAEKKKYIAGTSVTAKIDSFIGQIKASVDTPSISTGFAVLNKLLDDGLYEGLYILGAISSLGKTSFVLQLADQIAQQGQDVLIFSLEMAMTELMAKSISRLTFQLTGNKTKAKTTRGITSSKRYLGYNREEKDLIEKSIRKYNEYTDCLYIYEGLGNIGTGQIREIAETHLKSTGNSPVIVIDYLQILAPLEPGASDKQNIDKAVFELKRLSRDFKIPIIGISSLNRENYNSSINMSAFKESGAIEYSSDVLLGLQLVGAGKKEGFDVNVEKKKDPRQIELKILKNRNGATGDSITYEYYPMFNFFKEIGKL